MKQKVVLVVRILIGLMMLVVGLFKFIKPNFKVADDATLQGFIDSGWLWPMIGSAEVVGGASLVSGQYVPLGVAILTPVVAGIFAFALKTGGEEASVGVLLALIHAGLLWSYRKAFIGLFERSVSVD